MWQLLAIKLHYDDWGGLVWLCRDEGWSMLAGRLGNLYVHMSNGRKCVSMNEVCLQTSVSRLGCL